MIGQPSVMDDLKLVVNRVFTRYSMTDYVDEALEMIGFVEAKQIIQEVSGFVPVFEALLKAYEDPITALVFGRRWQYCRMEDGVCRASLSRLANDLQLDEATVMRHTQKLVEDGYFIDLTPERRNRPHVYRDAGRIVMKSSLTAGVAQSNTGIAQSKATIAQSNAGIAQSQLIKDSIKPSINQEQQEGERPNIYAVYEKEIGLLTPYIADAMKEMEAALPAAWILDAMKEAAANNKRNWKYVQAILKRWQEQGSQEPRKGKAKVSTPAPVKRTAEALEQARQAAKSLFGMEEERQEVTA